VIEEQHPLWEPVTPTRFEVTITDTNCQVVEFFNQQRPQYCILGRKIDVNGEVGLPDWKITAHPLAPGGYEPEPVYTNGFGEYKFDFPLQDYRIPGAVYKVCEEEQDGWISKSGTCQEVTLPMDPGFCAVPEDFENQQVGHESVAEDNGDEQHGDSKHEDSGNHDEQQNDEGRRDEGGDEDRNDEGRGDEGHRDENRDNERHDDGDADYYNKRGLKALQYEEYDDAIHAFSKAIDLKPYWAAAYYNRGIVYYSMGDYEEAIDDFNEAIELSSSYTSAYYNRGLAYYYLGKYDDAADDFDRVLEHQPDYAKAREYWEEAKEWQDRHDDGGGDRQDGHGADKDKRDRKAEGDEDYDKRQHDEAEGGESDHHGYAEEEGEHDRKSEGDENYDKRDDDRDDKCSDYHIVKRGDSLYKISRKYNVPLQSLFKANPFVKWPHYYIYKGQKVCIPDIDDHGDKYQHNPKDDDDKNQRRHDD
jgi:tetratricopeptide (TPR) repeat protein